MPTDSIEAAEAWRQARSRSSSQQPTSSTPADAFEISPEEIEGAENTTLEESLKEHRRLSAIAQRRWARAQEMNAPEEQRLYKIYQESKNGEMKIEKAVLAQKLESKTLIKAKDVFADLARILAEIRNDVRGIGIEISPSANPDDPGLALKVTDAKTNKLLKKWSTIEADALERITQTETPAADLSIPEEDVESDA